MRRWIPLILLGDLFIIAGVYRWWKSSAEAAEKQAAARRVAADVRRSGDAKRIAEKLAQAGVTYLLKTGRFPSAQWRKELEPSLPAAPFKLQLPPTADGASTDFAVSTLVAGKRESEVSSPPSETVLFFEVPAGSGDAAAPSNPPVGVVVHIDGSVQYHSVR
jgi:hypothetical protein